MEELSREEIILNLIKERGEVTLPLLKETLYISEATVRRELKQMEEKGVKTIIFTDIAADGMLSGPNFEQLGALQNAVNCNIIASGGVTTIEDVKRLRDMGLYGAIIGKAYYAGTVDLAEAIREAGEQC